MKQPPSVRRAIEARYSALSAQQRRAADVLLGNHRTAFTLSVSDVAKAASVSEATVVRFAREIGFAGYHELRSALMAEAKHDLSPEARFAGERPSTEPEGTLGRVVDGELRNIRRTIEDVDTQELRRFVARLRKASLVATMGLGSSSILARLAQYLLFQIGMRSLYLSRDAVTLTEQVELLPRGAVLLAFSFPPYSKHTVEAAARAHEREIPILAITDSVRSPVHGLAAAVLHAQSDNLLFTNSLTSSVVLLNAVVTELALSDKSRALEQLRATSEVARDEYLE